MNLNDDTIIDFEDIELNEKIDFCICDLPIWIV